MAQVDINHPPAGGFQNGGWYWDPKAGAARQWNSSTKSFGAPNVINNPQQQGYGQPVSPEVQKQSGNSPAPSSGNNAFSTNLSPLDQVNQTIQDSFQKLQDEVRQKFGDYTAGHPFKLDEVLASKRTEAKEQIDPFYDQQLGDYLTGVQRKIDRGANDTRDLLTELTASTDSYTGQAQNTLEAATRQAEQGFADNGLLNSGEALGAEGVLKQNTGANLTDYMRKADLQRKNLISANQRNVEDLNLGKTDFVSNLERNRFTDVENRAASLTKDAGQDYIRGFQATLPTQLQSASGFDMLKSLGIYS